MLDLATQSFSDEVKNLLVTLLNEGNQKVRESHTSERRREIMTRRIRLEDMSVSMDAVTLTESTTTITEPFIPESSTSRKRQTPAELLISESLTPQKRQTPERLGAIGTAGDANGADADGVDDANSTDTDYILDDIPNTEPKDDLKTSDFEKTDNKGSENEMDIDRVDEDILEAKTTKKWRQDLLKQPVSVQEAFDQEDFNLRQLLALSAKKMYGKDNLEDEKTLDRALRLLYMAKFGQVDMNTRISPHIQYNKLPIAVANSITSKLQVEEDQVRGSLAIVRSSGKLYVLNSTLQLISLLMS